MDLRTSLRALHSQLGELIDTYDPTKTQHDDSVERSKIVAKTKEIQHLMLKPEDMAFYHASQMAELGVLRTVNHLEIFEKFPAEDHISVVDLASATGVQQTLLVRMLRMMTATGYISQHPQDVARFALTPLGKGAIDSRYWYQFIFDFVSLNLSTFHKFVTDPNIPGYTPLTEATDPKYCPAVYQHGTLGESIWDFIGKNPAYLSKFQKAFLKEDPANRITGCYDFGSLASLEDDQDRLTRLTLVDVGGGQGQSIAQILTAYPTLNPAKFMLQDLGPPIEYCKQSNILPPSTHKVVHDFTTPQPPSAIGAKAYLLRRIIHDWADEPSVKILKHIASAMMNDSVILIADNVVPERIEEKDLPLVSNDWLVIHITGKERTEKEFAQIMDQAGLEIVQVHRQSPESGAGTIIEGRLKR